MKLAEILRRVCLAYDVTPSELREYDTSRRVSQARAAYCYWSRIKSGRSFPAIGMHIGRHYTTVIHNCRAYPVNAHRHGDDKVLPCMLAVNA